MGIIDVQASDIEYLNRVIDEIGACSSKREVNAVLARHNAILLEKKRAIASRGQKIRHEKKRQQELNP